MKRNCPEHPKFKRLQNLVGGKAMAAGILELLWHFTARVAPRGDIGRWKNTDIADACGWEGDPQDLINHLLDAGFLDPHAEHRLIIHDWWDHADNTTKTYLKRQKMDFIRPCEDMSQHVATSEDMSIPPMPMPMPITPCNPPEGDPTPSSEPPDPSETEAVNVVRDSWNEMAKEAGIPSIRAWTDGRRRKVKRRLRDPAWRDHWREALQVIPSTPFLLGDNERQWRIDIDFFLKADTPGRILEGSFAKSNGNAGKGAVNSEVLRAMTGGDD